MMSALSNGWKGIVKFFNGTGGVLGFHVIDGIFVFFIIAGLVYGVKKGLLRTAVQTLEFSLVLFLTMDNYQAVAQVLLAMLSRFKFPPSVPQTAGYFLTLSVVWAAVLVVDAYGQKWIQAKTNPVIRSLGGGVMGVVYFFLIFSVISMGLSISPVEPLRKVFLKGNSLFGHVLAGTAPGLYQTVTKSIASLFSHSS